MKIPKEIADKAAEYQTAQRKADNMWREVMEWLNENTDTEGVFVSDIYIADKPTGEKQSEDGEYCNQCQYGEGGDSFHGEYYHAIEGSDKYLGYHYEC